MTVGRSERCKVSTRPRRLRRHGEQVAHPGLAARLAVLPPKLLSRCSRSMRLGDTVSSIEQAALAEFIVSGRLEPPVQGTSAFTISAAVMR